MIGKSEDRGAHPAYDVDVRAFVADSALRRHQVAPHFDDGAAEHRAVSAANGPEHRLDRRGPGFLVGANSQIDPHIADLFGPRSAGPEHQQGRRQARAQAEPGEHGNPLPPSIPVEGHDCAAGVDRIVDVDVPGA